jgi:hypothetical protein
MAASLKPPLAAMGAMVALEVPAVLAVPAAMVVQAAMEEGLMEAQAGLVGPGLAAFWGQAAMGVHVLTGDQVSWDQQQQLQQL